MTLDIQHLLEQHDEDIHHPEVSGFEWLELLSLRRALAEEEVHLSSSQRRQLEKADARLLAVSSLAFARLTEIAQLPELRQRVNALPSHWWWYFDLLQQNARTLAL